MTNANGSEIREDLLEALYDLKHDLGKYIRLPVAMLPPNASPTDLRQALARGLFETRKGPAGVLSAGQIFAAFTGEYGRNCEQFSAYERLTRAVDRALALNDCTDAMERGEIMHALGNVSAAIQTLIEEVERDERK